MEYQEPATPTPAEETTPKRRPRNWQQIWMPLWLSLAFIAGILLSTYLLQPPKASNRISSKQMHKFDEVLEYVNMYYVDSIDTDKMFEEAIRAMLQTLDPHSTYATAEENRSLMETLEGSFEGVGIQFSIMNDTVMVVAVVTGGPSEKVGIRAGDRIISVDGKKIAGTGIANNDVMKLLRGKRNTAVTVGIKRQNFPQTYYYTIIRDVIPTYTVDVSYMIDKETGYIKINQFGGTTAQEFHKALLTLRMQGMTKLIIDLRGNPGGLLEAAVQICDELLPDRELIVYTEGMRINSEKIYATRYGNFEKGKVAILIDDFSASASEIVAGTVQDNDRGIVVGRRSFGKGLVQRQIDLSDSSSIRLTVARYHTPSGRCIQRTYKDGTEQYYEEMIKRYERGEMDSADSIKFDQNLRYTTKKGRVVYGGGGIMPDYFVAIDRDSTLTSCYQVINSGVMVQFAFDYANQHHEALTKAYPTATAFVANMKVNDQTLNSLLQFYTTKTKQKVPTMNAASREELRLWLKALIGRNLYQDKGFYPVINQTDKVVLKAVEEMRTER